MAFSFKSPLLLAINQLPSKQSDQLLCFTSDQVEKTLENLNSLFAFSTTSELQELLTKKGVSLAPIQFKVHSHPACKMIENHILLVHLPSFLKEFISVAFFSLRPDKCNKFLRMHQVFSYGKIKSLGHFNALIDSKDAFRYGLTSFSDFRSRVEALKIECLSRNKFPKVLLIHDELHHLEPNDIAYLFLEIPEIARVVATTVCPVELLLDEDVSKEPRVYTFKTDRPNDKFFFFPDGVASEGYSQKISTTLWPFKFRSLRIGRDHIRVSKTYSLFAHHVFTFDRDKFTTPEIFFDKPSCLLKDELSLLTNNFGEATIERKTVASLCTYMACLKTPNAASAVAKLRQLEKRDLYPDELSLVYSFGSTLSKFGMRDELNPDISSWFKDLCSKALPNFLNKIFFEERTFHIGLRDLNQEIAKGYIVLKRDVLRFEDGHWVRKFDRGLDFLSHNNITLKECPDRTPLRYHGVGIASGLRIFSLHINGGEMLCPNERVFIRFSDPLFASVGVKTFSLRKDFIRPIRKGEKLLATQKFLCSSEDLQSPFNELMFESEGEVETASTSQSQVQSTSNSEVSQKFLIISQDITEWYVNGINDAIVNAANECLSPGGGVSGAIHLAAGPGLLKECSNLREIEPGVRVKTGESVLTGSYNLKVAGIIQSVGPVFDKDKEQHSIMMLKKTLRSAVKLASEAGFQHLCLPLISCGIFGFDLGLAFKCFREDLKTLGSLFGVNIYLTIPNVGLREKFLNYLEPIPNVNQSEGSESESQEPSGNNMISRVEEGLKENPFANLETNELNTPKAVTGLPKILCKSTIIRMEDLFNKDEILSVIKKKGLKSKKLHTRESFYFSEDGKCYKFGTVTNVSNGWPIELARVCEKIFEKIGFNFNSMLVNLYNGKGGIGWHADDEDIYDDMSPILSVNLKGSCKFQIKSNSCGLCFSDTLKTGDCVLMPARTQKGGSGIDKHFHSVSECESGRINITFRKTINSPVQEIKMSQAKETSREEKEILNPNSTLDLQGFEGQIPKEYIDMFMESNIKGERRGRLEASSKKTYKNRCVFEAIAHFLRIDVNEVIDEIYEADSSDELIDLIENDKGLSLEMITEVLIHLSLTMHCTSDFKTMYTLNRAYGLKGVMYCVIKDNHCSLSSKKLFTECFKNQQGPTSNPANSYEMKHLFDMKSYSYSTSDAKKLAMSLQRGSTGVLAEIHREFANELKDLAQKLPQENFIGKIGLRMGFAGSGKTRKVVKWINQTGPIKRMFISPRRALAEAVSGSLKGSNCNVVTFETALKLIDLSYKEIILDEASLYPPGYMSLLQISACRRGLKGVSDKAIRDSWSILKSSIPNLYLIGDPLQVRYHCETDNMLLAKISDIDHAIMNFKYNYFWQAYRFGNWFNSIVEIPTRKDNSTFKLRIHSDISTVNTSEFSSILMPAQVNKRDFAGSLPVYTFSESQGLTFEKKTLIVINNSTFLCSPNAILVALSRSKVGFELCLNGMLLKEAQQLAQKGILSFIFDRKVIPTVRFKTLLGDCNFVKEEADVGASAGSIETKARNDPFIMPFIDLSIGEEEDKEVDTEITVAPEWFKCHIPVFNCNPLIAEMLEKMEAKEKREFSSFMGSSNQFLDLEKNGSKIDNYSMPFQAIFPQHSASDSVTMMAGIEKRIRKSNWRAEASKLEAVKGSGNDLCDEFLSMLPRKFEVTSEDIEFGESSFIEKRSQKTEKLWECHMERSDIDWSLDHAFMFMKSQFCTKEAKMFTEAKACQTLACFHHIILFKFGPMLRAIEKAFIRACGDSFYIHSGKNFTCLDAFVVENSSKFQGDSIESDYTAFDSSQDHVVLSFELVLLRRLGVSMGFIEDYKRIKLSLGSRLGNLAIMRFTGEFCTFLFNTFANMLFTKLKYQINAKRDRILFAGDDMCSIGGLRKRSDKRAADLLKLFSLKAVEEVKRIPMFCGWYLSPYGILKSPRLLWARICLMFERNMLHLCVDNYLFEAIFAYRLSERLFGVLKEEEFEYHFLVTRFFVKHSRLLKGSSRDLLHEIGESIGNCKMSMVKVQDFLQRVESTELKIDAIKSSDLYKDASFLKPKVLNTIKRFETNIKVSGRQGKNCLFSNFELLDKVEMESIRKGSGTYKFLHFGAILVGVKALLPNYTGLSGTVTIYDGACLDPKASHITSHKFTFEKDTCYFTLRPDHCLSTTDPNLATRLRFHVNFDCPEYLEGTELFSLDIGTIYRTVNSARFLEDCSGSSGWASQAISGCELLEFNDEIKNTIENAPEPLALSGIKSDLHLKERGPFMPKRYSRSRSMSANKSSKAIPKEVHTGSESDVDSVKSCPIKFESSWNHESKGGYHSAGESTSKGISIPKLLEDQCYSGGQGGPRCSDRGGLSGI